MFIKKVAPLATVAAVTLTGALLLTGCTTATPDAPPTTNAAGVEVTASTQKLIDAFTKSQEKVLKDGYTETASDGTKKIVVAYDPSTKRTTTYDVTASTANYVDGVNGTGIDGILSFLQAQKSTVTEKDGVYTVTFTDIPDSTLTITVKDGAVVKIVSATKGSSTWNVALDYKLTDEAKEGIAKAVPMPAPSDPGVDTEVSPAPTQ